jgi:hypothetical protein
MGASPLVAKRLNTVHALNTQYQRSSPVLKLYKGHETAVISRCVFVNDEARSMLPRSKERRRLLKLHKDDLSDVIVIFCIRHNVMPFDRKYLHTSCNKMRWRFSTIAYKLESGVCTV